MAENNTEYKPEWAKRLEDWGKRQDEKFSKKRKSGMDSLAETRNDKTKRKPKHLRKGEVFWSIVGLIISLFIVNYAPHYFPGFFTNAYPAVLYVINTVVFLQIIATATLLVIRFKPLYYVIQAAINALAVVSMITIVAIFPFNLFYPFTWMVRFGLFVGLVVTAITVVVQMGIAIYSLLFEVIGGKE